LTEDDIQILSTLVPQNVTFCYVFISTPSTLIFMQGELLLIYVRGSVFIRTLASFNRKDFLGHI